MRSHVDYQIKMFGISSSLYHQRDPPVQQLTVTLENGQYVYLTEDVVTD